MILKAKIVFTGECEDTLKESLIKTYKLERPDILKIINDNMDIIIYQWKSEFSFLGNDDICKHLYNEHVNASLNALIDMLYNEEYPDTDLKFYVDDEFNIVGKFRKKPEITIKMILDE